MNFLQEISLIIKIGNPLIGVITTEEQRLENILKKLFPEKKIEIWSSHNGLKSSEEIIPIDEKGAMIRFEKSNEKTILWLKISSKLMEDEEFVRSLKDEYYNLKGKNRFIIISSSNLTLPEELIGEMQILRLPPPDEIEIQNILKLFFKNADLPFSPLAIAHSIAILKGLKQSEIEFSLRRTFLSLKEKNQDEFLRLLMQEKIKRIKGEWILEPIQVNYSVEEIGGLENLKEWLKIREKFIQLYLKGDTRITPKGLLLMGISGCGKSLSVKAISDIWKLPLFRLDMNMVFSQSYGAAEALFDKALRFMESIAPAILWIDEIEMGISAQAETAVSARIFSKFLTWMQERKGFVFVAATANRIDLLPAEMVRRGRFDQIFFVDLPTQEERKEIFQIHLKKIGEDLAKYDFILLSQITENFSGAEIEQAVLSAATRAVSEEREMTQDDLFWEIHHLIPLATTMQEQIKALRSWAKKRALNASKLKTIME